LKLFPERYTGKSTVNKIDLDVEAILHGQTYGRIAGEGLHEVHS
jgi:hypothetical protein